MRLTSDKVINKCLLLAGFQDLPLQGPLKLQKFVFLCENELINRRLRGFSYTFFKYDYGPFSAQLAEDHKELGQVGLVIRTSLSGRGGALANTFREMLRRNSTGQKILHVIDKMRKQYGNSDGLTLKNIVYGTTVSCYLMNKRMVVKDIPKFRDIFVPEWTTDLFKQSLKLEEDDLESLELSLSRSEEQLVNMRKPSSPKFEKTFLSV